MPNYNKIIQCRLCGNDDLRVVFDFGDVPLGNNLQSSKYKSKIAEAYPLVLEQCQKCQSLRGTQSMKLFCKHRLDLGRFCNPRN